MYKPPYMPLYVDDYEADTAHLTLEEDGVYNRLLRLCWRTSGCSVPDDPKWISRRLRVTLEEYHSTVEPIIREFFERDNGRIYQGRQRREFNHAVEAYKKRAAAGAKGGRPRNSLTENENDQSNAEAMQKHCESNHSQSQSHNQNQFKAGCLEAQIYEILLARLGSAWLGERWVDLPVHTQQWRQEFGLSDGEVLNVVRRVMARRSAKPQGPGYFEKAMHDEAMRKLGFAVPDLRVGVS